MHNTINCKGSLLDLSKPLVMGIVNITDDSFYAQSRCVCEEALEAKVAQHLQEGASIIDIGAYSTRPGCSDISCDDEKRGIAMATKILNQKFPQAIVSVDTFRAEVARFAVEECGVAIVNDISGGTLDANMFATVANLHVPYILMHMQGTPSTMQEHCHYANLMDDIIKFFAIQVEKLKLLGVHDVILDPGYGFAKDLDQNYQLVQHLDELNVFQLPILVGFSRKSMIYKLLNSDADHALNGTTVLNTIALTKGAKILRVHDVKPAIEAIKICEKTGLI